MSWQEDEANVQVVGVDVDQAGVVGVVGYVVGLAMAQGHGQKRVRACVVNDA